MQTQAQNLLEGFLSIYDLTPEITNPYKDEDIEQSLAKHWHSVGDYLQIAMNDFDDEQRNNEVR